MTQRICPIAKIVYFSEEEWHSIAGKMSEAKNLKVFLHLQTECCLTVKSNAMILAFYERRTATLGVLPVVSIKLPNAAMKIILCTKMMYSSFAVNLWL